LVVKFNFRFGTASSEASLLAQVRSICEACKVPVRIAHRVASHPFLTEQRTLIDAVKAAVLAHTGITTREDTGGGTSDGRFISPTGAQVVELGPINATIHKIDECIATDAPALLKRIYQDVLHSVLNTVCPQ
jgi:succinyl-diaminopimelate desuccinylase